ncbi:zinc finger, PMZ-type containing protein [Tanacetum coccineum]
MIEELPDEVIVEKELRLFKGNAFIRMVSLTITFFHEGVFVGPPLEYLEGNKDTMKDLDFRNFTYGEEEVIIPNRCTSDPFLNRLCKNDPRKPTRNTFGKMKGMKIALALVELNNEGACASKVGRNGIQKNVSKASKGKEKVEEGKGATVTMLVSDAQGIDNSVRFLCVVRSIIGNELRSIGKKLDNVSTSFQLCFGTHNYHGAEAFAFVYGKSSGFENGICEVKLPRIAIINQRRGFTDIITPFVRKQLEKLKEYLRLWEVYPSGYREFEVRKLNAGFGVNLETHKCTCRLWDLTGIPCIHGVAAYAYLMKDPAEGVSDFYSKTAWQNWKRKGGQNGFESAASALKRMRMDATASGSGLSEEEDADPANADHANADPANADHANVQEADVQQPGEMEQPVHMEEPVQEVDVQEPVQEADVQEPVLRRGLRLEKSSQRIF